MQKKRITLAILLMIGIVAMSCVSAADSNVTDDSLNVCDYENCLDQEDLSVDGNVSSDLKPDTLGDSKSIYFDASAVSDGDGSQSRPYKYVKSERLSQDNDLTAYFADGTYDIDSGVFIKSNVIFMGQSSEKTIFNSKSNDYNFAVAWNSNLKLNNLTCKKISIINHGTLEANGVIFEGKSSPSAYGGIINSASNIKSYAHVYLSSCIFQNSYAYNGGSIILNNSTLSVEGSNFMDSRAKRLGGAIYSINSSISISNSNFYSNNASYGGVLYCEDSDVDLENMNAYNSRAYSFGGAIASKYSNITVKGCSFMDCLALNDAGGAIYNFKTNINITESTFANGFADFGGAIANLDSNLNIQTSRFVNNSVKHYGGAIYNIYGSLHLKDSFLNGSHAFMGGAINSVMTGDLMFTNNIFLNSTAVQADVIATDCARNNIVEYGNHYENIYYVYIEYRTYFDDEKYEISSRVLNYIVSNDGKYLNSYGGEDYGNNSDFVDINLYDVNFPDNSTIYVTTNKSYHISGAYTIERFVDLSDKGIFYEICLEDDDGNLKEHFTHDISSSSYWPYGNFTFYLSFPVTSLSNIYETGSLTIPTSLFETQKSDLSYIPSYYDGRDYGYVTPVKDQAEGGNCWAFAGLATLEACLKKLTGKDFDLSEENAKNLMASFSVTGLDIDVNQGGYDSMIIGYLNSWIGPIYEETEVYDDISSISSVYASEFHIQNVKFLPKRKSNMDNDEIKKAIMDCGAVSVTFQWLDRGLHSVSLVGWDDNYNYVDSLGSYARGAWIFKNSWGSDWWDNGFGYLSYDREFASELANRSFAYTFIFNKTDAYRSNYQYDYSGVNNFIVSDGSVFYKNKFQHDINVGVERLMAFSTYFVVPTNYTVSVYRGDNLVLTQSGYSDAGYYTIPFNRYIWLFEEDKEYTIMIESRNAGKNYVPVSQADKLTISTYESNSSFISFNNRTWLDLHDLKDYYTYLYGPKRANTCQVACIKAFTGIDPLYYHIDCEVSRFDSVEIGQEITINMTFTAGDYEFDSIRRINETFADFTINGKTYYAQVHDGKASLKIAFDNLGVYNLKASYHNNMFISNDDVEFNFTVVKKATTLSAKPLSKVYGGNEKSVISLKDSMGKSISNALITFNVGANPTSVRTDANGMATLNLNMVPKTYVATITYGGSGTYAASTKKIQITIKKATLKIVAAKKTFKRKVKAKKYTITLRNAQGKVIKGAKVSINVNGKKYAAKTNAKGQAIFKLTKLTKKGNHKATIKFAGNAYYNAASKKATITVK